MCRVTLGVVLYLLTLLLDDVPQSGGSSGKS